ncbi:MAG: acyloxyacyl hydrolase [Verrucomicrobiales bacterium]
MSAASASAGDAAPSAKGPIECCDVSLERYEHWEVDLEAGYLWRFRSADTPLDYEIAPVMLTVKAPPHFIVHAWGKPLVVRPRMSLLAEAITEGPESHYLGFSWAPEAALWITEDTNLFFSAGGGIGWIDSGDVEGGQGQDMTLNWFIHGGVRHFLSDDFCVSAGFYFQHNSNGGRTDPNPGLDTLGAMVGVGWTF